MKNCPRCLSNPRPNKEDLLIPSPYLLYRVAPLFRARKTMGQKVFKEPYGPMPVLDKNNQIDLDELNK